MRTRPTPQDHDVLTDDELERIREIVSEAEHSNVLTDWEAAFIDDVGDRLLDYGNKTRISDKMWEIINRIGEKLGGF
jgi:hypothetical protein